MDPYEYLSSGWLVAEIDRRSVFSDNRHASHFSDNLFDMLG